MIKNKSGSIINISSIYGSTGASCEVAYSISKAGIDGLTKSLAAELAPSNIRVNAISPGVIETSMNSFLSDDEKKNLVDEIPLGRIGKPSDVADCVLYLENCKYVTGEILNVCFICLLIFWFLILGFWDFWFGIFGFFDFWD